MCPGHVSSNASRGRRSDGRNRRVLCAMIRPAVVYGLAFATAASRIFARASSAHPTLPPKGSEPARCAASTSMRTARCGPRLLKAG